MRTETSRAGSPFRSLAPLLSGFVVLLLTAASAVFLASREQEAASGVRRTIAIVDMLNNTQTRATDAETGQRGYLLTGRLAYLEPFETAKRDLVPTLDRLATMIHEDPSEQSELHRLRDLIGGKLAELQQTVDQRAAGREDAALAIVNKDTGQALMTAIRGVVASMIETETLLLDERSAHAARLNRIGQAVLVGSVVLVLVFGAFAVLDGRKRLIALQDANVRLHAEATERRAAEAQLRQLQKMEAVGQLTGGIAHDFNNMLAIVIGFLDLARRRLGAAKHSPVEHDPVRTDAVLKWIDQASEGATRAVTLTKRLLAFSRQQPLEPAVLDPNKLVGGMSELLRRVIGEAVGIETVLAGGIWTIHADASQLENAIVNLAVNARDAMLGGGKLTIETGNADLDDRYAAAHHEVKAGQYVMLSVTDTGAGMAPAVMERAFDPFFTTKGVGKGTGLGLSQVFGFVKQSGGHVKLYSEVAQGTTVKVYLPRYRGDARASTGSEHEKTPATGCLKETILVVEDEARVRLMTVESLRELGYTVIHAALPTEALQHLDGRPDISLLLTDIVMPEMSGRQLADAALARHPHLKVLFTTGYTRNAVVHNGIVDPGTAFLPKPFALNQLAAKVRQTLDG